MTSDDSPRIAELFEQLVELPPAERAAALDRLGAPGSSVRREVEALLTADAEMETGAGSPLLKLFAPQADPAEAPRRIGPYRLVRKLGEGGMSEVFLGLRDDGELESRVAIKVIRQELLTPEMVRRFEIERQILASLSHPSIARVLDAGRTADGVPYFIMEYIEGEPIDEHCDRHRLSIAERLQVFRQVCLAVHCAHQNLVVHRDIKPSNILVNAAGEPKLLDFGIAKLLNPDLMARGSEPTIGRGRLLTPEYASPEQVLGKPVTAASDVYSLGVLLFKLLTGADPYRLRERTGAEVEQLILSAEPDAPSAFVRRRLEAARGAGAPLPGAEEAARRLCTQPRAWLRALEGDLDAITAKALRKEPQHRYASAEQMAEAVHRHLAKEPEAPSGRSAALFQTKGSGSRWRWAAVLTLGLVTAGLSVVEIQRFAGSRAAVRREQQRAHEIASLFRRLVVEAATDRELVDRAARLIHRDLAAQPSIQADLLMGVGQAYSDLSLLDEAAAAYQEALKTRQRLFGPEHAAVAESLTALAGVEARQGSFDDAEALLRSALAMRLKIHRGESLEVTRSQVELGRVLLAHGHTAAAEPLFLDALLTREKLLGSGDVRVAEALTDLGHTVGRLGSPSAAEFLFRRAGKIVRRSSGRQSWDYAISLVNRSEALFRLGQPEEGAGLLREAAEIERRRCAAPGPRAPLLGLAQAALRDRSPQGCPLPALPVPRRTLLLQSLGHGLAELGYQAESEELLAEAEDLPLPLGEPIPLEEDTTPAAADCVPDGGFAETFKERCCSGVIAGGTTHCSDPLTWGSTWKGCRHVCGSRLVNGCVPRGGVTDTLGLTDCCSRSSVSGSGSCLSAKDFGTSWRTCVFTCS